MITLSSRGKGWAASFPYHPDTVSLVKQFPGAQYNPHDKSWSFGSDVANELLLLAKRDIIDIKVTSNEPLPPLASINLPLDVPEAREYQKQGISFGLNCISSVNGVLLADDMGIGKTFEALNVSRFLGAERVLVICPAIAKYQWMDQIVKWLGNRNIAIRRGTSPKTINPWLSSDGKAAINFNILNYDVLQGRKSSRRK